MLTARSALVWLIAIAGLVAPLAFPKQANAQQYPSRAITIITTVGTGSNFDLLARVFAERLRQKLGVPVLVENVSGGGGIVATQRVLYSKSDGYTLLIAGTGLSTTPAVMKNAGYKAEDFLPLAPLGQVPFILYASNAVSANDIPSMMAYLKTNIKDVNCGVLMSSNVSMMLSRKFGKIVGGDLTEVGYRASPEMVLALLTNDIQIAATTHAIAGEHVVRGKIKAIGAVSSERARSNPDLPTFKEKGFPLIMNSWETLFAKADVPLEILNRIRSASKEIVSDPSYLKAMETTGMEPWTIPFDSLQSVIDGEIKSFTADAKELNIKFE